LGNISGRAAGSVAHRTRRDRNGKPLQIANGVPAEDDPGIILPDGVEEVVLLGDGDSDRQTTLMKLLTGARRFQAQGKRVFVDMAPPAKDWNTVLAETPETEQADPDLDHGTIQGIDDFAAMIRREELEAYTSKFAATWFHQIGAKKPTRNWLMKNLLLSHVFGLVYGGPNGGKSFLTTDLALSAALAAVRGTSVDWFGHKTKGFGTIYLVAEGREDFEIRLHAWRTENGVRDDEVLPFVFLPTTIDLRSSEDDVKKLIEEVKVLSAQMQERCRVPASLVVVDTVARALAGGNENASEVMGAFVINCDRLKDETGCTVLGVHHGGKEAGRGPRGHESLHGATDFEFEVTGAQGDSPNVWRVAKNKSAAVGAFHKFRLKQRVVGADEDGDPITSCVVIDLDGAAEVQAPVEDRRFNLKDKQREFCQALADAIDLHGHAVPPDLPAGNNVSMVAQWEDVRRIYNERLAILEAGDEQMVYERLRKRWNEALKDLLRFKVVGSKKPYAWFTGKALKNFTIRGAAEYKPRAGDPAPALPPDDAALEKELPF